MFNNPLIESSEYNNINSDLCFGRGPIQVSGLCDGAKAYLISVLAAQEKHWKLVITYDEARARAFADDIGCFCENVYLYPARDLLFYSADIRGNFISGERIDVWRHMSTDPSGVVVTTVDALMDKLEAAESFREKVITIKDTDRINTTELAQQLAGFGYERYERVEARGQFAVRGGIIDIFPLTEELPVRIELWDEEIDSMRSFDAESQRSVETRNEVRIYPAAELKLGGRDSFLRYFDPEDTAIFVDEPARAAEKAMQTQSEFEEGMAGRIETGQVSAAEIPELFTAAEVFEDLRTGQTVYLTGLDQLAREVLVNKLYHIESRDTASYRNAFEGLTEDLKKFRKAGCRTIVLSASRTRTVRLSESLREYGIPAYVPDGNGDGAEIGKGEVAVLFGNLHKGFEFPQIRFAVISESDIFGVRKKKRLRKKYDYESDIISSLSQLAVGDFVVHEEHGLGIYRGIEKIERDQVIKDYIKIEYAGGDNCYLPATKFDLIQKYSGSDGAAPKLNRLGTEAWGKTKAHVKKAVAEIAKELIALYAARLNGRGYVYGPDTVWQKEFEEMFEFDETEDQLRAIEDIKRDMEQGRIMDRLICGDVGYGKTEVALRAAFKCIQEGRQVIYLVPTTILAQQHFNTFSQRMKDYPVRVELLSRFRTAAEQKKVLEDFAKGLVDVIIGTHRVLSKDIAPKKLGLLIIDEEQRFGVKHKEKLKQLRQDVDVLTLTATPIPRTLHMSLSGIRDLSVLEEPPQDRQPIQTYVMEYSAETVKEAIRRELSRGGQVYYVYNRVSSIAEIADKVQALCPGAEVAYAHGQMNERELERVMLDFINGEIDVLVSTTIIETGLDIPNVNTMIVHDADRLGLSQLYQLRGRVGRSSRTAFAFLLYKKDKMLSEEAEKRLRAIREFTELGSGIRIAMRDLEIRGAGNVLGAEQHGHMQAVGYDLYCKMLNTAVRALKGENIETTEFDTTVDADMDAFIPSSYIASEEEKLDIYKRIASIETKEDYMDMQDELLDRFGDIPEAVDNLLRAAKLKSAAHALYITDMSIQKQEISLRFYRNARLNPESLPELVRSYAGLLRIRTGDTVEFILKIRQKQINCRESLAQAEGLLEKVKECL